LFFVMIVVSIAVLVLSIGLARSLLPRLGGWNAASFGVATYVVIIAIAQYALPQATKSPSGFPQPSSGASALPYLACTSFVNDYWPAVRGTGGTCLRSVSERTSRRGGLANGSTQREVALIVSAAPELEGAARPEQGRATSTAAGSLVTRAGDEFYIENDRC
jgi:hypothetical protein